MYVPINSKQKGKRVELKVVHWLHDLGFVLARRGQQYAGGAGSPDVVVPEIPSLSLEVKGRPSEPSKIQMLAWLDKAEREAGPGRRAALVLVVDGRSPRLIWLDDVLGMLAAMTDDAARKVLRYWMQLL